MKKLHGVPPGIFEQGTPSLTDGFLDVMRTSISSVNVITACHEDKLHGITVSSLISLSTKPPAVLASISAQSRLLPMVLGADHFAVSLLSEDQQAIAEHFSRRGREISDTLNTETFTHKTGAPLIQGCSAWLELELTATIPVFDHVLMVGTVMATGNYPKNPLAHHNRQYFKVGDCG